MLTDNALDPNLQLRSLRGLTEMREIWFCGQRGYSFLSFHVTAQYHTLTSWSASGSRSVSEGNLEFSIVEATTVSVACTLRHHHECNYSYNASLFLTSIRGR